MKKLTKEKIENRLQQVYGDSVTIDFSTYIGSDIKCCFIDKDYGAWFALPRDVLRGHGHKERGDKKRHELIMVPIDIIEQRIKKIHGDVVVLDKSTYVNTYTKCRFVDKDYGEWWAKPNTVIDSKEGHKLRSLGKRKITCLEKYGADNPSKCTAIKIKTEQTCIKKFGTIAPMVNKEIQEKAKQTNLKNLGVEHPAQNKEIQKKMEHTNLIKYGVENVMYSPEIAARAARNQVQSTILCHWLSGEEVVCQASYEVAVVNYLTTNKIDYNWKPKMFLMPNGHTYTPDLYLPDLDLWIEIKGYFRKDAEEKWNWFHKEHKNSELWNETKLKSMGIL